MPHTIKNEIVALSKRVVVITAYVNVVLGASASSAWSEGWGAAEAVSALKLLQNDRLGGDRKLMESAVDRYQPPTEAKNVSYVAKSCEI